MIVNVKPDGMNERLTDEYRYLANKYDNIAFSVYERHRADGKLKEYLLPVEGYITIPDNYNVNVLKTFKGVFTPNSKFYSLYKDVCPLIMNNGPLDSHNYYALDNFVSYDEKINGICALNNIYHTGREGDVVHLREQWMNSIKVDGWVKHTWGPKPWGGNGYQGTNLGNHGNHINNLTVINKYKFMFAPEPMYHELWSWDWVTERMWNAFKSKTIPIYIGCYNIENLVPSEFYIDMRKFSDLAELGKHIQSFTENQYIDITEKAYEWYYNTCKISNMNDLEELLSYYNSK